jgi:hypothetical protein
MVTGLDVAEKIRASGVGRKMFLTTPFIDQAIALIEVVLSAMAIFQQLSIV